MTRFRGTYAAAAVALLLLSAACANNAGRDESAAGPGSGPAGGDQATGDGALALRVEHVGGFVPPEANLARMPQLSVYADGRVINPGPQIMIYPGPALPSVEVTSITPEAVQALIAKAREAGVREGATFGRPGVADAPDTRITLTEGGTTVRVDVSALSEALPEDPALTAEQQAARAKMSAFIESLSDLRTLVGAGNVTGSTQYAPERLAAVAAPWRADGVEPGVSAPPARTWPGPALPGELAGAGIDVGCATVTGDQVAAVLAAAKDANALTPWTSGGKQWRVTLRPLLPDEADCAALKDAA